MISVFVVAREVLAPAPAEPLPCGGVSGSCTVDEQEIPAASAPSNMPALLTASCIKYPEPSTLNLKPYTLYIAIPIYLYR